MFGENLRRLRRQKKLNQRELAAILKVSSGTVGMWETETRRPDAEMLKKIANFFNVTIDFLLDNTEETYKTNKVMFYTKTNGNEKIDDLTEEQINLLLQFAKQMKNKNN